MRNFNNKTITLILAAMVALTTNACTDFEGATGKGNFKSLTVQSASAKDPFSKLAISNEGDNSKSNEKAVIDEAPTATVAGYSVKTEDKPSGTWKGEITCPYDDPIEFNKVIREDETMVCTVSCENQSLSCVGTLPSSSDGSVTPDGELPDSGPKPDGEVPDQKVIDPDSKVIDPDSKVPDPDSTVTKPDSTVTKPDSTVTNPDTGTTTGKGALSLSAVSGGVLVAANCTATMGSNSSSGTTTTSATSPLVLSGLPVGMWTVVCSYDGSSKTVYVTVTENATTKVQMSLGSTSGSCTANTLLQKDDFTIPTGTSKNLAGTFQYCDSSGCKQTVPDSQLVLTVSSGSSLTVSGLIVNATNTTGGTYLQYCWTAPIWGGGSTCKTFYGYAY